MIIFTVRFYYTGNRKTVWQANSYVEHAQSVKYSITGTPFNVSNYPKKFKGIAIRNRESFATVF